MNSKFLSFKPNDFVKGLLVAVGTVVLTGLNSVLQTGAWPTGVELHHILIAGGGAAVAYLAKNFFTNSNGQIGTENPVKP